MKELEAIYQAILEGDHKTAAVEVQAAIDGGLSPGEILNMACMPAMTEVGRLFEIGERYVPEMLIAARAMDKSLEILEPLLVGDALEKIGKVAIGTVAGDMHDVGKNLVAMMLRGAGFDVVDLGTDVAPQQFVDTVLEIEPDLIGLSALLTTTMGSIDETLDALSEAGLRDRVKVIIGGAPITQGLADNVGADGYAPDAASAARVAKALVEVG